MDTTTTNDELARRLRAWRGEQRLTVEQAAVRVGVASSTLKRWEKGRQPGPGGLALLERAGVLDSGSA